MINESYETSDKLLKPIKRGVWGRRFEHTE